jgi:hypothetical protein
MLEHEYRAKAAILRTEAKRVLRLYRELRQGYNTDVELTTTIEEMAQELRLNE